jgi:hypothetical protein
MSGLYDFRYRIRLIRLSARHRDRFVAVIFTIAHKVRNKLQKIYKSSGNEMKQGI